ncbi:hypothetical protein FWF89_01105 [Candidatus Saccharibacteria bacterium]|nr:hypothetical protein [Candidatus Saccharibacteria bacterium]
MQAKANIKTIPIILGGEPLIYEGLSFPRATIDFEGFIPEKLWANEGFLALTKSFCSYQDVIDLQGLPKRATAGKLPEMPLETYAALVDIAMRYCSRPKAVSGFKLYFDATELDRDSYIPPNARLQGMVNSIMHNCAGHMPVPLVDLKAA